jgi:hypothetical protein
MRSLALAGKAALIAGKELREQLMIATAKAQTREELIAMVSNLCFDSSLDATRENVMTIELTLAFYQHEFERIEKANERVKRWRAKQQGVEPSAKPEREARATRGARMRAPFEEIEASFEASEAPSPGELSDGDLLL